MSKFSENRNFLKVRYYRGGDLSGSYFLKDVLDNISSIQNCIDDFSLPISSITDLYKYLWCLSFNEMLEEINLFKIDVLVVNVLVQISKSIKLDKPSFINYINKNYQEVFNRNNHEKMAWYDFFERILDLIYNSFSNSISEEVFNFLEKNFPLHILSKFDICEKYYKKNKQRIQKLFDGLEQTKLFDDQIYLTFLSSIPNGKLNIFYKEKAEFITKRTLDYIKSIKLSDNSQEIIEIQNFVKEYGKLARLYETPTANEYVEMAKKVAKLLDSFIKKHGQHFKSGPYDLRPAIDMLKKETNKYKFLGITHNSGKDKIGENALNYIFSVSNKKNPLSEVFNDIGRNRSEKYPYFKQDSMQINLWIRNRLINLVMGEEKLSQEFADYIYNVSLIVEKEYFNNSISIEKETTGLVDVYINFMNLAKHKQFDIPYTKEIMYGSCLHICSLIEKMLRNASYKELKGKVYFDQNKVSLASLFKNQNSLKDISDGLKYFLEFYLIKEVAFNGLEDDRPGLNIRNKLMHNENDIFLETTYETYLTLFYLLISLLNDLFIKCAK